MGRIIGGRYEVGALWSEVSQHGKTLTFMGRDRETGRDVVIGALKPALAADPAVRAAFRFGLDQVQRLAHPGFMRVLARDDGADVADPMFVTEKLAGKSLSRLFRDGAIFTERKAVDLVRSLVAALEHAHAADVFFGNIKPSNVLVTDARDRAIIVGLPKPPFSFSSIPQLAAYLGIPFECPPELLRDGRFDARADLYGAGLVLYTMCTGTLPFRTLPNLADVFAQITDEGLPPPSSLDLSIAPGVESIVRRAVALRADDRYPSARQMGEALERVPARPVAMLTRERLKDLATNAFPSAIAQVYGSLPYQPDEGRQLQRLIDVACATVQFLASIAIAERIAARAAPPLPKGVLDPLSRPSLGHWFAILRENSGAGGGLVAELPTLLADDRGRPSEAARAFEALIRLRNEFHHGVTLPLPAARRRLAENLPHLGQALAGVIFLRDYRLFVPRSLDFVDGEFVSEVGVLAGAGSFAEPRTVNLGQPVKVGQVHMADAAYRHVLSLHPLLVVAPCPTCEDEELFFYESAGDARAHFLSFAKAHTLSSEALLADFEKLGLLSGTVG